MQSMDTHRGNEVINSAIQLEGLGPGHSGTTSRMHLYRDYPEARANIHTKPASFVKKR
jgi:hypothetical protein